MDVLTKSQILHDGIQNILNKKEVLRGKQWDAIAAMVDLLPEQITHSYFKLPTGFGKTVMFTLIADAYLQRLRSNNMDINKNKVIILVPRLSLIDQTLEKLNEFSDIDSVGVLSSLKKLKKIPGMKDVVCFSSKDKSIDREVIISTYQSMEKLFQMVGDDVGLVIADEAHHAIGNRRISILNHVAEYAPIIGFTATPVYSAERSVADLLGTEIYSMDVKGGVEWGMICPVKNILYRTSMIFDPSNLGFTSAGDFNWEKIIEEGAQFDIMVREIAQICAYGECDGIPIHNMKIMINCPNIDIATAQARAINKILGRDVALPIHSRQKNFEQLKDDFKNGKFSIACQVNTLTEGFDDETVTLCINYPSASRVRIEQASGRVLRNDPHNDQKVAYVLDTLFHGGEQETIEDSIINAHERGQVLFMDIGGGPVLFPKDFPQKIYGDGHRGAYDPIAFDFELITDSKILMVLEQRDKDWTEENTLRQKTVNDLTSNELAEKYIAGGAIKIQQKMVKYQSEMPYAIEKMQSGSRTPLCLHSEYIDKFCEHGTPKLYKRLQKTNVFLKARDLAGVHIIGSKEQIAAKLKELQNSMPYAICRISNGLYLHQDYIDEFCERANMVRKKQLRKKTKNDLAAHELSGLYIVGIPAKIQSALEQLQSEMPYAIEEMQSGGHAVICLHLEYLKEFCERTGLKLKTELLYKQENLLSVSELAGKYIIGSNIKIRTALKMLQDEMPHAIKEIQNGSMITLALDIEYLDEFCEKAGLQRKQILPRHSDNFLHAKELAGKHIVGNYLKIRTAMETLQNEMPYAIKGMELGGLYLDITYLDEFCERSGMRRKQVIRQKTKNDLSAAELAGKYIVGQYTKIQSALEQLQSEMPYAIEEMQSGTRTPLCLHIEFLDEFCERAGLKRKETRTKEQQLDDLNHGTVVLTMAIVMKDKAKQVSDSYHK